MEAHYGVHLDGDWDFLSKIFSTEEMDFAQQFLDRIPNESEKADMNTSRNYESSLYSLHTSNTSLQYNSQDSGNGSVFIPTISNESYCPFIPDHVLLSEDMNSFPVHTNMIPPEKICTEFPHAVIEENNSVIAGQGIQLKRELDIPMSQLAAGNHVVTGSFGGAKKPRVSVYSSNNQKFSPKGKCEEENSGTGTHSHSSGEDNASQELNGVATSDTTKASAALNSNGKTRASRGSATDPQSLYARKRRERINERLRILQHLVPNGTKVDISTMLEEAVHYVKFLQLQIKLLSSDDMWMYAPIVYNSMDFGFNQKISSS